MHTFCSMSINCNKATNIRQRGEEMKETTYRAARDGDRDGAVGGEQRRGDGGRVRKGRVTTEVEWHERGKGDGRGEGRAKKTVLEEKGVGKSTSTFFDVVQGAFTSWAQRSSVGDRHSQVFGAENILHTTHHTHAVASRLI